MDKFRPPFPYIASSGVPSRDVLRTLMKSGMNGCSSGIKCGLCVEVCAFKALVPESQGMSGQSAHRTS